MKRLLEKKKIILKKKKQETNENKGKHVELLRTFTADEEDIRYTIRKDQKSMTPLRYGC